MIESPQNEKLKLVRKLRERKHREREGLFASEGEDLVEAGLAAGAEPRFLLTAAGAGLGGEEVEPGLLDGVSALGSGTRAIAVWPLRWADGAERALPLPARGRRPRQRRHDRPHRARAAARHRRPRPRLRRPLLAEGGAGEHGLGLRPAAAAGRGGADAGAARRPLAHSGAGLDALAGARTLCLGAEREGLPAEVLAECAAEVTIPLRSGGAESLNVAAAAAIGAQWISSAPMSEDAASA